MVTNIDLSTQEVKDTKKLSSIPSLLLSLVIVGVSVAGYLGVLTLKKAEDYQQKNLEQKITETKTAIMSSKNLEISDFQLRVMILDKLLSQRTLPDKFVKELSFYVLPDFKISSLDVTDDFSKMILSGTVANYDVLARVAMLLRKMPGVSEVSISEGSNSQAPTTSTSDSGIPCSVSVELDTALSQGESQNKI